MNDKDIPINNIPIQLQDPTTSVNMSSGTLTFYEAGTTTLLNVYSDSSGTSVGSSVTLKRNPDYWAKDLPEKRGFDNFDEIRIEYIRNDTALFEAFTKGIFDVTNESNPTRWTPPG